MIAAEIILVTPPVFFSPYHYIPRRFVPILFFFENTWHDMNILNLA